MKPGRPFEPDAANTGAGSEASQYAMHRRLLRAWRFRFFLIFQSMIATKDSIEPHSSEQLPASTRVYVQGELFPEVRVPMREIALSPTKTDERGRSR